MTKRKFTWLQIGAWLLNKRWWLAAFASLSVFLFEFLEYQPFDQGVSPNFFFEILFYGIALPLSVGIALSWAAASRAELAWSAYFQDLAHNLNIQLHNAHSNNEVATVFLQFIRVVLPVVGITIYKYEQDDQNFKNVLNWSLHNETSLPNSEFACGADVCPFLPARDASKDAIDLCQDPNIAASTRKARYYCLPFLFSNSMVAGARLTFQGSNQPSPEQIRLLKEIAPAIASSFHRIQLEGLMKKQDDSISAEQHRIARDVHDSLGHNLAYLRLRLDQISMEFDPAHINTLHHEVESLRDVAKETYDQMRDVLTMLTLPNDSNLSDILFEHAERIKRRGILRLKIHHEGEMRNLSPVIQRNSFHIFKEALTNIEKHAQAHQVNVDLLWQETGFVMDVCDDGIGFDPTVEIPNGHFGLKNIRERALEIGARLDISSKPGQGTRLTLYIPYEKES